MPSTLLTTVLPALIAITVIVMLVGVLMFGGALTDDLGAAARLVAGALWRALSWTASSFLTLGWYTAGVVVIVGTVGAGLAYNFWYRPGGFDIHALRPPVCTELLDRKGAVLDYVCPFEGLRIWRPLDAIGTNLRMLVVMLEDDKFYEHGGLDIDEIWNALQTDIERHKLARGGSTITQQLAKNLFLTNEKSVLRKVSEIPLALRLEKELDKDEILELYLNTIEWGPGIYGAEAASRLYFDCDAASLTDAQAWLLALMIPNPKELNLWLAPKARRSIMSRARHLASRMVLEHRLSEDQSDQAYHNFETFVTKWQTERPTETRIGRRFPARWQIDHSFSLAEIASVRRGAAGLFKRYRQEPLRLNIDLAVQEKLEAVEAVKPVAHAHDLSDVVALMDGESIRAMIPIAEASTLKDVQGVADAEGLKTQVFHARNIPKQALWP